MIQVIIYSSYPTQSPLSTMSIGRPCHGRRNEEIFRLDGGFEQYGEDFQHIFELL